ncbi:unnamed protein product [Camellia sinensis]
MASKSETTTSDEMQDVVVTQRGCCCQWMPCFSSNTSAASPPESWWSKGLNALMKIREWSEVVAGPRWKTFIRRFNRNRNGRNGKFQYDPLSYTLNFDEGEGQNRHFEEDRVYRDFSSRYAAIPLSAKSTMDLGKERDALLLT